MLLPFRSGSGEDAQDHDHAEHCDVRSRHERETLGGAGIGSGQLLAEAMAVVGNAIEVRTHLLIVIIDIEVRTHLLIVIIDFLLKDAVACLHLN